MENKEQEIVQKNSDQTVSANNEVESNKIKEQASGSGKRPLSEIKEDEARNNKRREACRQYAQKNREKELAYLEHLYKEQKRLKKHVSIMAPKVAIAQRQNAKIKSEVADAQRRLHKLNEYLFLREVEYEQLCYWKDVQGIEVDPEDPSMQGPICDNCYEAWTEAELADQAHFVNNGSRVATGFSGQVPMMFPAAAAAARIQWPYNYPPAGAFGSASGSR